MDCIDSDDYNSDYAALTESHRRDGSVSGRLMRLSMIVMNDACMQKTLSGCVTCTRYHYKPSLIQCVLVCTQNLIQI